MLHLKEYEDLKGKIAEYREILADKRKIDEMIIKELEEIKEKYGVKSLETLIRNYDIKLIGYEERRKKGEKMDLAIQMAERRKKEYESALQELK